jgi:hypothetical protein
MPRGDHDALVIETHAPSSAEIPLRNDVAGVRARGARAASAVSTAGIMIRDRELRAFCRHLLGWSEARAAVVDDAVDGLLIAVARGMPIALRGSSDLVPVAYALHRRILGAERPFVVCDPRRRDGEGSVRDPPNRRTGTRALEAAMDGSLCLRSCRLPADFDRLRQSLREDVPAATIFVCLQGDDRVLDLLCRPLEIPPLSARTSESDRLLQESLDEAATELGAASLRIPRRLRQGVLERVASFAELEKTALRVVALVSARNIPQAAERLRMAPVSLTRWLCRRPWLMATLRDLDECRDHADD